MSNISDPIADLLTRVRNAYRAGKSDVKIPFSRVKADIAKILKDEGYIAQYEIDRSGKFPEIKLKTKFAERVPALTGIRRVSKPGLRNYVAANEIPRVLGGLGVAILSTSRGVITGRQAKRLNVGGELMAIVW